jgi:hypothetical protein
LDGLPLEVSYAVAEVCFIADRRHEDRQFGRQVFERNPTVIGLGTEHLNWGTL